MPLGPDIAPERRRKSLFLTFGTNLGIMGVSVATGMLNARLLGPTGRGELAAIQTVPSVLAMVALLGVPSAVGYFTARSPSEARAITKTALMICLAAAVPTVALGYAIMPWALHSQPPPVVHDARMYLVFVVLQAIVLMPFMALQGMGRFRIWNALRLAPNISAFLAIALMWIGGTHRAGIFTKWYLAFYAVLVPLTFAAFWRNSVPSHHRAFHRGRELVRYGLPSAIMNPVGLLNLQLDQMLMAAWLPSDLLGLYAVGVSWSGLLSPAFSALGFIIFPALAAADHDTRRVLVGRSMRLAIVVVVVLGAGLIALTPFLLPLFFGKSFATAVRPALILVGAGMILNLNGLCGEILRGVGAPRWPLFGQLAALPVTVGLLLWLLPRWTIFGAAVSSLVAYGVAGAVGVFGIARTCQLSGRELLVPGKDEVAYLVKAASDLFARMRAR